MNTTLKAALVAVAALAVAACSFVAAAPAVVGSGTAGTTSLPVASPFKAVRADGALVVEITHDAAASVTVEGDDNLIKLVQAEVTGGMLKISHVGNIQPKLPLRVVVKTTELVSVGAGGAVTLSADRIEGDDTSIGADGAATVTVASVKSKSLKVRTNGAAQLSWTEGTIGTVDLLSDGASKVKGAAGVADAKCDVRGASQVSGIAAARAVVTTSGAGSADIDASETLQASATGASSIRYGGTAAVKGKESASSSVRKRE